MRGGGGGRHIQNILIMSDVRARSPKSPADIFPASRSCRRPPVAGVPLGASRRPEPPLDAALRGRQNPEREPRENKKKNPTVLRRNRAKGERPKVNNPRKEESFPRNQVSKNGCWLPRKAKRRAPARTGGRTGAPGATTPPAWYGQNTGCVVWPSYPLPGCLSAAEGTGTRPRPAPPPGGRFWDC